uniref:Serine/threonine-protein phosphatase n=1 Tax=Globodera pallida TaxID=36090 RepID=A0A183BUC4_GLOPA
MNCWCLLLLQIGTIAPDAFARSVSGITGTDKAARSANGAIALESFVRSGNGTNAIGNGTNASGNGTNASGNGTNASGNGTNASGNGTNASGNGTDASANVLRSSFKTFTKLITSKDIQQLCRAAKEVLKKKTSLAEIEPPIFLFGDVHGQYSDVLRMFNKIGYPTGDKKYMFIGDFVDRGNQSLEVAVLLMSYMVKYADTFVLLRGNHEVTSANFKYGFKTEIESRYGEAEWKDTYRRFNKAFALLPFAGLVGNKILCMHGGISPRINSLQQLRNLNRSIIDRLPDDTAEKDLLWADPNENITGIIFNKDRHTSIYFGMDVVDTILKRLDIDRIVRAHQVWDEGIKYFAGGRLISVFSAARYQGKKHNTAVVLNVTADLNITVGFTFEPNYGTPATPNFVIGITTISATPINAMANATINLTKATTGATTRSATISATPINAMASATISPTTGGAPTNGTAYTHALRCWLEKACQSITIESAKLGGRFKVIDCDGALAKLKTANDAIILALGNEFVGRKDGIFLREYVP